MTEPTKQAGAPTPAAAPAIVLPPAAQRTATVTVRPVKSFRWGNETKEPRIEPGEPFEVARHEAIELHANGSVVFANAGEEKAALEAEHKAGLRRAEPEKGRSP
jgi:hypothetical protein